MSCYLFHCILLYSFITSLFINLFIYLLFLKIFYIYIYIFIYIYIYLCVCVCFMVISLLCFFASSV